MRFRFAGCYSLHLIMHFQIYIPHDICQEKRGHLLGFKIRNVYIVIQRIDNITEKSAILSDVDFRPIGYLNESLRLLDENTISLRYEKRHRKLVPVTETIDTYTIVSFSPPNLRNLEYFTVRPILLHSTGSTQLDTTLIDKIARYPARTLEEKLTFVSEDSILDKINRCQKIRAHLVSNSLSLDPILRSAASNVKRFLQRVFFAIFSTLVSWLLALTIPLLNLLNQDFYGSSPVKVSVWCKQLDLRLRQISYFPIQFLCYYDPSIMSISFLEQLELPETNKRHNINNSNYINLYNSLWLIVNDILVGTTAYRMYMHSGGKLASLFNEYGLRRIAFEQLHQSISWVGSDHPAGFKLNNELGQFMQGLFLWTIETWRVVFEDLIKIGESDLWLSTVVKYWFFVSSWCGISFSVAAFIDYVRLATLHIYYFNIATTKIFHRQVEMLKSLTQLFRGKKYNVLRNRIDNLDEDQFHIDQLLLGTFIFMILIYLLPTTFAFYLLFFLCRVAILLVLKIGNKIILTFNLYPLFVILLKLKNSRRLQGGIYFETQGSYHNCNWLTMENRALTFDEILGNFIKVFRQEGKFKRLAMNFVEGYEIVLRDTQSMKFHYLMLPGNYDQLVNVWQSTNVFNN